MTRFGDQLRQERQSRGLSVEDVCAVTKVSAAHVNALEAGEFDRLPGGVFRKGIVRSYLAALALDETLWMERFTLSCQQSGLTGTDEQDWVQFAENVKKSRSAEPPGMALRWLGVAILMVTLFAVIWLAWHFVRRHRLSIRETTSAEWIENTPGRS
jgi:cytoskeleton protein RodZ